MPIRASIRRAFKKADFSLRLLLAITSKRKASLKERLSFPPLNKPLNVTCNKIHYSLNLNDPLQKKIFLSLYESKDLQLVLNYIKPGAICIDVGANIGFYTLHMAKALNNRGKVYAFEADPGVFEKLKTNCGLNNFSSPTVQLFCAAVSNKTGETEFYQSSDVCTGSGSIENFPDIGGQKIQVKSIALDDFLEEEKISNIDMLKVDIEGHEFSLLQGAESALKKHIIKNIFLEFNGQRLRETGYRLK